MTFLQVAAVAQCCPRFKTPLKHKVLSTGDMSTHLLFLGDSIPGSLDPEPAQFRIEMWILQGSYLPLSTTRPAHDIQDTKGSGLGGPGVTPLVSMNGATGPNSGP